MINCLAAQSGQAEVGVADPDRQPVGDQRRQAALAPASASTSSCATSAAGTGPWLSRSSAMIRPRTCRSVPCQVCTARLASTGRRAGQSPAAAVGERAARARRRPRPCRPARPVPSRRPRTWRPRAGSVRQQRRPSAARSAAVAGSRGSSTPRTTLDSTRRTLVSTTGVRAPKAKAATARAVYSPIPGSVSRASTVSGTDAAVLDGDRGRGGMQAQRPPRVAEPTPRPDGGRGGVGGQIGRVRPAFHPRVEHRQHPDHRRLLQHHLADQHGPR